jgi:hypothetical protein
MKLGKVRCHSVCIGYLFSDSRISSSNDACSTWAPAIRPLVIIFCSVCGLLVKQVAWCAMSELGFLVSNRVRVWMFKSLNGTIHCPTSSNQTMKNVSSLNVAAVIRRALEQA